METRLGYKFKLDTEYSSKNSLAAKNQNIKSFQVLESLILQFHTVNLEFSGFENIGLTFVGFRTHKH